MASQASTNVSGLMQRRTLPTLSPTIQTSSSRALLANRGKSAVRRLATIDAIPVGTTIVVVTTRTAVARLERVRSFGHA
jgi:hypothetical protein